MFSRLRLPFARCACVVITATLAACSKPKTAEPAAATPATAPTTPAAAAAATAAPPANTAPEAVTKMLGRWVRADGGYVLELRRAEQSGAVEAAYFNPKPIRVSRAHWMRGAEGLQVFVELNDVGYPGATYVLAHDAANDRLVGRYTQPTLQQTFDIEFLRQPER